MKSLYHLFIIVLMFSLSLTACKNDKEEILYKSNCDTANVTYTKTIVPIVTICNSCHAVPDPSFNNVVTSRYDSLSSVAKNGKLWLAVSWTGSHNMPKGGSKLSDCDLAKIKKWIDVGEPKK